MCNNTTHYLAISKASLAYPQLPSTSCCCLDSGVFLTKEAEKVMNFTLLEMQKKKEERNVSSNFKSNCTETGCWITRKSPFADLICLINSFGTNSIQNELFFTRVLTQAAVFPRTDAENCNCHWVQDQLLSLADSGRGGAPGPQDGRKPKQNSYWHQDYFRKTSHPTPISPGQGPPLLLVHLQSPGVKIKCDRTA